jgi:hypothetical protein
MAGPTVEIQPPVRRERQGGIRSVATFRENERLGAAADLVFQSDGCSFPEISEHLCYVGEVDPANKTFDGIELHNAIGEPFPLYSGVQCFLGPDPDQLERARAALEAGRDRQLESAVYAWAQGGVPLVDGVNVADAIALVEQALDGQYLGQGVILMSRADAVRAHAAGALEYTVSGPVTINGTPVIASGFVGQGQVFGLGSIVVEHSGVEAFQRELLEQNQLWALAEQVFAIIVDCEFRVHSTITPAVETP